MDITFSKIFFKIYLIYFFDWLKIVDIIAQSFLSFSATRQSGLPAGILWCHPNIWTGSGWPWRFCPLSHVWQHGPCCIGTLQETGGRQPESSATFSKGSGGPLKEKWIQNKHLAPSSCSPDTLTDLRRVTQQPALLLHVLQLFVEGRSLQDLSVFEPAGPVGLGTEQQPPGVAHQLAAHRVEALPV